MKQRYPIELCLSLGFVDEERARLLADAGLDRLNHNLNTSESHYPEICSTHDYADRLKTLATARKCGVEPCSGLIVGMGEASEDIVDLAFQLRELEVRSIPVNFLIPIEGNPLQGDGSLTPTRCLRVLALMRLVNPAAEVRISAGREGQIRSLGALALWPANSLFIEGYLTTRGAGEQETYRMIEDAGFEVLGNPTYHAERSGREASSGESRRRGGEAGPAKSEISEAP
jgi:biotin synthase